MILLRTPCVILNGVKNMNNPKVVSQRLCGEQGGKKKRQSHPPPRPGGAILNSAIIACGFITSPTAPDNGSKKLKTDVLQGWTGNTCARAAGDWDWVLSCTFMR